MASSEEKKNPDRTRTCTISCYNYFLLSRNIFSPSFFFSSSRDEDAQFHDELTRSKKGREKWMDCQPASQEHDKYWLGCRLYGCC